MTTESKTVHSFWIPLRILKKLRSTTEGLGREKGIKISPNQLAMKLIDDGLNDEKVLNDIIRASSPLDGVVNQVGARHNHVHAMTTTTSGNTPQPIMEEICLEDKYSASYKIKIPPKNQDAEDEEQIETEIAERKCSLYHHRPETLEVLAHHIESTLNLISRNLKAERRNSNETSGLKTSPRKEVQHRKK